ncbi:hypothetical protein MtrunA17_Chr7g0233371 [Medicago truncatula]|uniref:Uncharacterized protein n=1 Tax=Medicago truncatula TaxID=3880 RepID=A0A396H1P8_MEDTR|nr:hypothetical protein MtrunA17_Chr7g0233371 [Medicago truncatula]
MVRMVVMVRRECKRWRWWWLYLRVTVVAVVRFKVEDRGRRWWEGVTWWWCPMREKKSRERGKEEIEERIESCLVCWTKLPHYT